MPQYWIQTPVENAKEVVQRYLDDNSATLSAYAGATVNYDEQCEVVLYNSDLLNFNYDVNTIYFGNFILPISDVAGVTRIVDSIGNEILIFDMVNTIYQSGNYKSVIWNVIEDASSSSQLYFIGYKFNITTP